MEAKYERCSTRSRMKKKSTFKKHGFGSVTLNFDTSEMTKLSKSKKIDPCSHKQLKRISNPPVIYWTTFEILISKLSSRTI